MLLGLLPVNIQCFMFLLESLIMSQHLKLVMWLFL